MEQARTETEHMTNREIVNKNRQAENGQTNTVQSFVNLEYTGDALVGHVNAEMSTTFPSGKMTFLQAGFKCPA